VPHRRSNPPTPARLASCGFQRQGRTQETGGPTVKDDWPVLDPADLRSRLDRHWSRECVDISHPKTKKNEESSRASCQLRCPYMSISTSPFCSEALSKSPALNAIRPLSTIPGPWSKPPCLSFPADPPLSSDSARTHCTAQHKHPPCPRCLGFLLHLVPPLRHLPPCSLGTTNYKLARLATSSGALYVPCN
jgi:hypothetical protein